MNVSPEKGDLVKPKTSSAKQATESSMQACRHPEPSRDQLCTSHSSYDIISESMVVGSFPRPSRDLEFSQSYDIVSQSMVVGSLRPTCINVRTDDRKPENKPLSEVSTQQHNPAASEREDDVVLTGREQYEDSPTTASGSDESSDESTSTVDTPKPKHKSQDNRSSDGSTSTVSTTQSKFKSGETISSEGSESTLSTPHGKRMSQGNSSSGSSAVSDTTRNQVVYSRQVLEIHKIVQMFQRRNTIKLKKQKMKLKCKHSPTLHLRLEVNTSSFEDTSAEYIILHTHIVLPPKYNHVLDTAKFQISVTLTYHSATSTPLPLPQPQPQTFTLTQENKHMLFNLFSRTFMQQSSTRQSVDLVIEVQPIYYMPPEDKVLDYVARNPTESLDFVDIQNRAASVSTMSVIEEKAVSVTNREETIEWKERGLILHVPKDSLPTGCNQTNVRIVLAQSDPCTQAQDSQHTRYILYGLKFIDGEEPRGLTLEICRGANTPQSRGSEPPTLCESPNSG